MQLLALLLLTGCGETAHILGVGGEADKNHSRHNDFVAQESGYTATIASRDLPSEVFSESGYVPRNLGTKAIKKALRIILTNKRKGNRKSDG